MIINLFSLVLGGTGFLLYVFRRKRKQRVVVEGDFKKSINSSSYDIENKQPLLSNGSGIGYGSNRSSSRLVLRNPHMSDSTASSNGMYI